MNPGEGQEVLLRGGKKMRANMGLMDRLIRAGFAVLVAVLYLTGQLSGVAGILLGILAVVFLATAAVGTCPLYLPLGLSTKKKD